MCFFLTGFTPVPSAGATGQAGSLGLFCGYNFLDESDEIQSAFGERDLGCSDDLLARHG